MFPTYHGLVSIHRAPSIHSLVPPSHKLSILRGLSSSSSQLSGGGENNLGFRCTRKRFVIETLHLDVEGGVSERRTTPSSATTDHDHHNHSHAVTSGDGQLRGKEGAKVLVESPEVDPSLTPAQPIISPKTNTKPKKKVAFHSDRPDLYDF